jgi:hypothetical protein
MSAAELFSEKMGGGVPLPHEKVENNYLADLSAEAEREGRPVRRRFSEAERKAKMLAGEGDNQV